MCGIVGFVAAPDRPLLERMAASLTHRGPDDSGFYESPQASLGMRRLSIIDLETGQQPVFNEDRSVVAVFNGEIYNYVELRESLAAAGHRFRSDHSDSEVIVHLYEDHGADFVEKLDGMFAIALWDSRTGELLLIRDRVGIKPLYVSLLPGGLVFGSEPKALLVHPGVSREPNLPALHHYFSLKNLPAPLTAFTGMEQLRPGEMLRYRGGQASRRRWWQIRFEEEAEMTEAEAAAGVRERLERSVGFHMRSDVPFGAYLSGGLDSSSVVALMSRLTDKPVQTFTLAYEDDFANKEADRAAAQEVSRLLGSEHHERVLTAADLKSSVESIADSFDEPFSGVTSTYFVTALIREHVKVALSGDGADELFGSYLAHRLAVPLEVYGRYRSARSNLPPAEQAALGAYAERQDELAAILERGDLAAQRMGQYIADDAAVTALYSDEMRQAVGTASTEALVRGVLAAAGTDDPLNRALFLDFETLLPDQVLAFVDRLSMAHSVEVRPPFLDHHLVEFVARIPGRHKIREGRVKHVLKEAMRGLIPQSIIDRPKEGFIMPVNDWIMGPLRGLLEDLLSPASLRRHGLIRQEPVRAMVEAHVSGRANHGNRLWNLMMFQLWWDRYIAA